MNIKSLALEMYPYWLLGIFVLSATYWAGFKDVIRVEKKPVIEFLKFLGILTIFRILLFKFLGNTEHIQSAAKAVSIIPWPATLTVFWEDACHGLPLFLIRKLIGTKKWTWPIHAILLAGIMLEFGLGHVYQGAFAAFFLSFYIPYSINKGEKYGFGTVMICHTLFDLITILSMKFLLGA